jgi:hypothetical protein
LIIIWRAPAGNKDGIARTNLCDVIIDPRDTRAFLDVDNFFPW